jgi:taurine dioxygenase
MALQIRRMGYALGAEITGVDLRRPLDDGTVTDIRRAWLDHLVLCFPNQDLTGDQLVAFTSRFGDVENNGADNRIAHPDNPHVAILANKPVAGKPWDGYKEGQSWHSDRSCSVSPMTGTFLLSKEIPDVGGDTMFANQYMAYESLSPAMKDILDRLSAVHDLSITKGAEKKGAGRITYPLVVHPVVKIHAETKRKALYVGQRVRQFVGMTEEESKPLLDFLTQHAVTYEFTYRHRWSVNQLVMWDNRCTMHIALSDYDLYGQPRHMIRCSLLGPQTGHVYEPGNVATSSHEAPQRAVASVS